MPRKRRPSRRRPARAGAALRSAAIAAQLLALVLVGPSPALAAARAPAASSPARDAPASPSPLPTGELPRLAGLSLTEALLALQSQGLQIIFTSQLVQPSMRVEAEPVASEPRAVLDELLAPHGLAAEDGAGGTVVVVLAAAPQAARPSIAGTVRSALSLAPLAGVAIRVVERGLGVASDAEGGFAIGGLPPGAYTLEAELRDFFPGVARAVVGAAGDSAPVAFLLQEVPFIHDEIVVRPSRLSLLQDEPVAPLALSRSQIEALPHLAEDAFRALSLLPGAAANDVTAQFHVHGGRRDEVQILLDGQELYEAYHLQDYDRALSVVAPGGLAGASLSTGAFPALYGDRMSGVLDLTTTVPAGGPESRLSLSLVSAEAASGGSLGGERGSWLAAGRRGSIELASRLLGREDPAFWDLFGKVGWRLDERSEVRAHLLHAGDALAFEEASGGEHKRFDTDYDSSYLWASHDATLGGRLLVETTASATRLTRDRNGTEDEEEQSFEIFDRRTFDVAAIAQSWTFEAPARHALKGGFEARRYEASYGYRSSIEPDLPIAPTDLVEPGVRLARFAGRFSGDHVALHAADRFSPFEPLTVELGLRYDRHTLTEDTLLSPRVNLAWRIGEAGVLRGAWGHFHQSHRPYELQVEDGETRFRSAERSEHWVLGYERLLGLDGRGGPLSALRVEAYRREIRDPRPRFENLFEPINNFPEAEVDRVRITPERGRAQGIELMVEGAAGSRATWWLNYAYSIAEDRIRGREVPRQTDQTHALNLFLETRLGKSWSLSAAWRYHTGWPTTPVSLATVEDEEGEESFVAALGRLNSERLPSYHRMDVRASRQWSLRSGRLVFSIDVQNLYNRKNLAGFDLGLDAEEGRLVLEDEAWPGFFPSLGIAWEF